MILVRNSTIRNSIPVGIIIIIGGDFLLPASTGYPNAEGVPVCTLQTMNPNTQLMQAAMATPSPQKSVLPSPNIRVPFALRPQNFSPQAAPSLAQFSPYSPPKAQSYHTPSGSPLSAFPNQENSPPTYHSAITHYSVSKHPSSTAKNHPRSRNNSGKQHVTPRKKKGVIRSLQQSKDAKHPKRVKSSAKGNNLVGEGFENNLHAGGARFGDNEPIDDEKLWMLCDDEEDLPYVKGVLIDEPHKGWNSLTRAQLTDQLQLRGKERVKSKRKPQLIKLLENHSAQKEEAEIRGAKEWCKDCSARLVYVMTDDTLRDELLEHKAKLSREELDQKMKR